MNSETGEANDREVLVNLAIYDYHAAIDRGEVLDPAMWAARNPEIAPELNSYFEDLGTLGLLRPPTPEALSAATNPPGEPGSEGPGPGSLTAEFQAGDKLGDYVLLEKLGEGGQGVVWKASPQHSREIVVALKTLRGPASSDLASLYRLREDARAIARMKHANIVRTSYFGEDRGRWFFVMELIEGGTVADLLESYKADPRSAAVLIEKIARAIHHAHTRNPGVLHLDLKPGNILLTSDGEPKVTDFGLSARIKTVDLSEQDWTGEHPGGDPAATDDVSATFARAGIVGTLPFLSPEMAGCRWSEVSTASDIYGLGAVLFTMLTGREPFRGRDARETLALIVRGDLTNPRDINVMIDRELNAVCRKCLDICPDRRYGSADELANDLRRWLDRRPTLAGGKPSAAREYRFWARRHPLRLAVVGVAAVSLWMAGLVVSAVDSREKNRTEVERLASRIDRELDLICNATQILAKNPNLRRILSTFPGQVQVEHRQRAIEEYLKAQELFKIVGRDPLVNIFVLGPDGVMLADTLSESSTVGKSFGVRDYYRPVLEKNWPLDHVYVARSFLSSNKTGNRYKIAVSTRISDDRGKLLGVLVANFTIGPRLIAVDLRQEPNDATVLCPMDRSDPDRGVDDRSRPWPYIPVLDRRYDDRQSDWPFMMLDSSRLPDFQGDATPNRATGGLRGGKFVDYHRVGQTHMVVEMRRDCPWPFSWLPDFR